MKIETHLTGVVFSVAGFFYILWVTANFELGVSPDSTVYIEVAENFVRKGTFTNFNGELVTQFPPLYSFSLAVFSQLLNTKVITAASYFSALCLAISIFLSNLLFIKCHFNAVTRIVLNLFLALSPAFTVFLMVWSESLFIPLLLTLTLLMYKWMESNNRLMLMAGGMVAGLLVCTRYAGLGMAGGIILFLLFQKQVSAKEKIRDIAAFSVMAAVGPVMWSLHAISHAANPTGPTEYAFHLISRGHLEGLLNTFTDWLSPSKPAGAIVVVLVVLYVLFQMRRNKASFIRLYADNKFRLLVYITAAYIGFLLVSISLFNFLTPLDNRILSPIYPCCILLAVPLGTQVKKFAGVPYLPGLLAFGLLFLYAYQFYKTSESFYNAGSGYTGAAWANSESLNSLTGKKNLIVYSNAQEIAQVLGPSQNAYVELPMKENPVTKGPNEKFAGQMQEMRNHIQTRKGILVFLAPLDYRTYYSTRSELQKEYEGFKIDYYQDGFVISVNQ